MNSTPRLAVIGAGLAGLSCAAALQQAGLKVTVCEKSRGAAGRMGTRRGEDWQCDHGAQYVTARHPDFRAEVERWVRAGVAGMWAPRLQVLGGSFDRVPDAALERFVGVPAMTVPARHLAQALSLVPQTTITQVQRAADRWQLLTTERGWLIDRFDAVLLATPAPPWRPHPASLDRAPLALCRYRAPAGHRLRVGAGPRLGSVRRLAQRRQGGRRVAERPGACAAGTAVGRLTMSGQGRTCVCGFPRREHGARAGGESR